MENKGNRYSELLTSCFTTLIMICALVFVSIVSVTVEILHEGMQLPISFQLWVQSCHVGSLILAIVGVCTPWKSADTAGPHPPGKSVVRHAPACFCSGVLLLGFNLSSCTC